MGGFFLVVDFHWGGSATNKATPSGLYICIYIFKYIHFFLPFSVYFLSWIDLKSVLTM